MTGPEYDGRAEQRLAEALRARASGAGAGGIGAGGSGGPRLRRTGAGGALLLTLLGGALLGTALALLSLLAPGLLPPLG